MNLGVEECNVISKITFKRLVKDYMDILKNPLHSHGIYYIHDEENILCGTALIIGQRGTPYEHGYYLFDFKFPLDYPTSPPKVTLITGDGVMRFHPNMYINGNVCLSILNTWYGDQWTSCQSISSLLLTLCSILSEHPILYEPGVKITHSEFKNYHTALTYKNYQVALLNTVMNEQVNIKYALYKNIINSHFLDNFTYNSDKLNELYKIYNTELEVRVTLYNVSVIIDYGFLIARLNDAFQLISTSQTD